MTDQRVIMTAAHHPPERPPLRLAAGDRVTVGERHDEWPAFVFVTAAAGAGWVPSRHLSGAEGEATVLIAYDTKELAAGEGDVLTLVERDDESGWLWCRDAGGETGWVPISSTAVRP